MKQSESITKLLESFTKAQAEFPTLPKDKNGYNYKYTDLDTVISTLRPILARHSLGFMQSLTNDEGRSAITTRLFNSSGEWIEDTTTLPDVLLSKGNAAQNLGAAITYMKRYTLCAVLGISCDEDPDGKPDGNPDFNARNQSEKRQPSKAPASRQQNASQPAGGPDTPEEARRINELIHTKNADGKLVFTRGEVNGLGKLRMTKTAKEVIQWLSSEAAFRTKPKEEPFPEDIPYDTQQELPIDAETEAEVDAIF